MGNLITKCLECFKQQEPQQPIHQLVNLSKNPDTSVGQVNPQQISFVLDKSSNNDTQIQETSKDVNDVTLEVIPKQQFQGIQSPDSRRSSQNQENQPILQEECKTNPNEDQATPISAKDGMLILKSLDSRDDLIQQGLILFDQFEEELEIDEGYEQQNQIGLLAKINMKAYQSRTKKYIQKIKIEDQLQGVTIEQYQQWSDSNQNKLDGMIQEYRLEQIHQNIYVGQFQTEKYVCITPKEFKYLKFSSIKDGIYYELFRSFETEDGMRNIGERANLLLGGIKIEEKNDFLFFTAYFEVDVSVRLPFAMTKKAFRDKTISLLNALKQQFQ